MRLIVTAAAGLALLACTENTADTDNSDAEASGENTVPASAREQAAQEQTGSAQSVQSVRLYVMDCGRIDMLDLSLFSSDGEYEQGQQHQAADMCFLIRHPEGDLMWDAGLADTLHNEEEGITNGPFRLSVPKTLESQLTEIGVTPAEIEYFSFSHSHFDHVGNAALFAGSTLLIDQDERDHMFRPEARANGESFALVAPLQDADTITFDGDYDVFGDGSVTILAMPGHTPGHTSLRINLENEGPVLLTGDLYHLLESRKNRIVPSFNSDKEETLRSMDRFEQLARETGALVIIQHSLEDMNAMPLAPAYLD